MTSQEKWWTLVKLQNKLIAAAAALHWLVNNCCPLFFSQSTIKYFLCKTAKQTNNSFFFVLQKFTASDTSGCGINEEIISWMDRIQSSGLDEPPPAPSNKSKTKDWKAAMAAKSWNNNVVPETPGHKYSREANEDKHRRTRRASRPKEDNKNTCSLFIQTDPLIWRHISEQVIQLLFLLLLY